MARRGGLKSGNSAVGSFEPGAEMVVPPHAEHRDRCYLPVLAGLAGQRWQDREHPHCCG